MARFICVESTIADLHTVGKKYQKMIDWCIRVIEAQPAADVAPVRRGKWEDKDGGIATCSTCGTRWGVWDVMNFCPNCGAKMDGGDGE